MLAGHADEIAMAVNYIDDNGYLYVRKMGGVDAAITKAQRVVIHTAKGPVKGVVGNVAPHLIRPEDKEPKPLRIPRARKCLRKIWRGREVWKVFPITSSTNLATHRCISNSQRSLRRQL
jgi:hypothetical protein